MRNFAVETISFDTANLEPVIDSMHRLSKTGDGLGWINIGPGLRDDQINRLPEPTMLGRWFSGRGPVVPMATWTPQSTGNRPTPVVVGIEHGAGPKALDQLRDAGLPLPQGWRKVQDHAKRGIVMEPAPTSGHAEVLKWLISACWALCPINLDDHWLAEVHQHKHTQLEH